MENIILATGGTGYVGSWVVRLLLEKGYTVRLTVRDKSRVEKFAHLEAVAQAAPGRLELWEADLNRPGSYDQAAQGCQAIVHMASPFTLRFEDARRDLVDPAVNGTRNVLEAANKAESVRRVVLTSSVAAIHGDNIDMKERGLKEFNESHFNQSSSVIHQPYSYSKVAAEQAAWQMARAQDRWKLVVVNPSFVMGPSMTASSDSESIAFMRDMLTGKYRSGAPDLMFGFVDVRDVAQAHLLALEKLEAEGRHLLAERVASVIDLVKVLKELFGKRYKLPLMPAPKAIMMLVAPMFGLSRDFVRRNVGHTIRLNTTKSREVLGLRYTDFRQTLKDMAEQMQADGMLG